MAGRHGKTSTLSSGQSKLLLACMLSALAITNEPSTTPRGMMAACCQKFGCSGWQTAATTRSARTVMPALQQWCALRLFARHLSWSTLSGGIALGVAALSCSPAPL
jgi:hypothetical protein